MPRQSANPREGFALFPKPRSGNGLAEEKRLLARARKGDRAAQRALLESVAGTVSRFGKSFCRDPHDAEDVAQDVLVKLLEELPAFRGESALSTWAFVVARRTCAARRRRAARTEALDGDLVDDRASPARAAERAELRGRIEAALRALPPAQREVVLLRDVEGRGTAEVARALGLGERAVKSRLHRARLALRRALTERPGVAAPTAHRGCPRTALLVSRYLEGELSASVCQALEAHVLACPHCLRECAALRGALGACRTWGAAKAPRGTRRRVTAALTRAGATATR